MSGRSKPSRKRKGKGPAEAAQRPGSTEIESAAESARATPSPVEILERLVRMTQDLERAWSGGMNTAEAQEARKGAVEAWTSFLQALLEEKTRVERELKPHGLDKLVYSFPANDQALASLDPDPLRPEQRFQQLDLAFLYTLQALLEAVKAIEDPTGSRLTLISGEVITWWEAGAFALVRSRARSLQAVLREMDNAYAALGVEPVTVPPRLPMRSGWEALLEASYLLSNGHHEAALVVIAKGLRSYLAEHKGVGVEELGPLPEALGELPELGWLVPTAEKLLLASTRLQEGLPLTRGFVVPLAVEALRKLQALDTFVAGHSVVEEGSSEAGGMARAPAQDRPGQKRRR